MSKYLFVECTSPDCRLRFPLDPQIHQGKYCPLCGSLLRMVSKVPFCTKNTDAPSRTSSKISGLLDNIRSVLNVGSALRIADGAGLAHLYLCGITPNPKDNPTIAKTALGAELSVSWSHHRNAVDLAKHLISQGSVLVALENIPDAECLYDFHPEKHINRPTVLITGSETAGVDPDLLALCEHTLFLPMRGTKESLNASVAFGIAAYWLSHSQ